tara:strand:- start:1731 stop:1853 length:123 start_codon:yes stop_codon:yes gene_type:complete
MFVATAMERVTSLVLLLLPLPSRALASAATYAPFAGEATD